MANSVVQLRAIALTAFQETLRRKAFYLVLVLVLFILAIMAAQTVTVHMASEAGETTMVAQMHTDVVTEILSVWTFASSFLALYLGAVGVSSEVTGKTLMNVLSRPVSRATYLTGRWLGTLAFLWIFQAIGLLLALGAARYYGAAHTSMVWLGCAEPLVSVLFLSGVSLGSSVVVPPVLAGAIALLLPTVPLFLSDVLKHPNGAVRLLANVGYYIAPAKMPVDLLSQSFSKELIHPAYGLYSRVLAENVLYAVALFAIACVIFARREIRLR